MVKQFGLLAMEANMGFGLLWAIFILTAAVLASLEN